MFIIKWPKVAGVVLQTPLKLGGQLTENLHKYIHISRPYDHMVNVTFGRIDNIGKIHLFGMHHFSSSWWLNQSRNLEIFWDLGFFSIGDSLSKNEIINSNRLGVEGFTFILGRSSLN